MHTLPYQSTQPYETALNFLNKPSFSGPLLVLSWESRMWLLVLELPFTNSETLGKPLYIYRWFSELAKEFVWVFIKCYGKIWMNFLANWRFFSSVKWGSWLTPGSLPCLPCTEQHLNQSAPAVACINHLLVLGYCLSLCLTLCDPMDSSPPGFSVHGILQATILESYASPCSRGSLQPRDGTQS